MTAGRREDTRVQENQAEAGELPSAHHRGRGLHAEEQDERSAEALISAVELLGLRSEGPEPFTVSPSNDPIAFLLDAMADAVSVRRGSSVMYRNRAAEQLELSGCPVERRSLDFRRGDEEYVLEILHERS